MLVLVCIKAWSVFGAFQGVPAAPGPGTKGRVLSGVIIPDGWWEVIPRVS